MPEEPSVSPSLKQTRPRSIMKKPSPMADDPKSQLDPYRNEMILVVESPVQGRVLERVEVVVSFKKGRRVLKIICVSEGEEHEEDHIPDMASVSSAEDSLLSDSEYQYARGHETSFLEEFARSVLDPCQCQTFLKPALRKEYKPDLSTRSVSFDKVDIKEFPMTLGDHPSAASGPPVALDWEKVERERCVGLDEYEANRSPRRNRKQLKLTLRDRRGILQKQFSAEEVNQAWKEARVIREQRRETIQRGMMMMFLDDMMETTNRKVQRIGETFTQSILW